MKALLNLLIPPVCLACHDRLTDPAAILCNSCHSQVVLLTGKLCPKCGSLLNSIFCDTCSEHDFAFEHNYSVFQYGEVVQQLVHSLKYDEYKSAADYLINGMQDSCRERDEYRAYDAVIPVPLHPVRKRERGYNQSEILARALASSLGIKYSNPLKRRYYTKSQTLLSKTQRIHNLNGAFALKFNKKVEGKAFILVDDVFTTGSTVNEISKLLLSKGARKVAVITAARA